MLDARAAALDASTGEASFTIAVRPNRPRVTVAPCGELDMATVDELSREIDSRREMGFSDIVVDLAGVTFLDSTGLRVLLSYERAAREGDLRFRLTKGPAAVQRLFELTATQEVFEFLDRSAE